MPGQARRLLQQEAMLERQDFQGAECTCRAVGPKDPSLSHLATQIPQLNCDCATRDLSHVEANCRDHVLMEGSSCNHVHEGALPSILQADK